MKKLFFLAFLLFSLALTTSAFAHGLNVFAWLENDHILVQCDFGQNRPATGAAISVYDNVDKRELLQGRTDAQGRFAFRVPDVIREGHGLLIVADAGQGHRGEWTMDAAELYSAASLAAGFDQAAIQARQDDSAHIHVQMAPAGSALNHPAPTAEQIRNVVQEALELKLAPIRQEIAMRSSSGPTFTEIIGGIGWIIGLIGIGMYFKARKS